MLPNWLVLVLAWLGAVTTISAYTAACFRWLKKHLEKWIRTELMVEVNKRIETMEGWNKAQQEDIDTLFDEKLLIFRGLEVALMNLPDKGAEVEKSLISINSYLYNKSAMQRSRRITPKNTKLV